MAPVVLYWDGIVVILRTLVSVVIAVPVLKKETGGSI